MVIPQPPHPRSRPPSGTSNVPGYHAPADRTERSTKDPTPVPAHQVKLLLLINIYKYCDVIDRKNFFCSLNAL